MTDESQARNPRCRLHLARGAPIGVTRAGLTARVIVYESEAPAVVAEDGIEDLAYWDEGAVD